MPTLPAAASLTAPLALIRSSRETEEHSLVKQPATQLFIYAYKHNSGNAPLGKNFGDTRRLKLALQLFKGFLTREERAQLLAKPKEEGDAKQEWQGSLERLASKLNMLAVKRLVQAFNDDNKRVPKMLANTTVILNVSSVETYFGKNNGNGLDYKDNKIDTVTAPDSLLAFRVDYEAECGAAGAAQDAPPRGPTQCAKAARDQSTRCWRTPETWRLATSEGSNQFEHRQRWEKLQSPCRWRWPRAKASIHGAPQCDERTVLPLDAQ